MTYQFELATTGEQLTLDTLKDGELAIVIDNEFKGELFYKNVIGLHSISSNRYWPSEYAIANSKERYSYRGPLHLRCRRIIPNDVLNVRE